MIRENLEQPSAEEPEHRENQLTHGQPDQKPEDTELKRVAEEMKLEKLRSEEIEKLKAELEKSWPNISAEEKERVVNSDMASDLIADKTRDAAIDKFAAEFQKSHPDWSPEKIKMALSNEEIRETVKRIVRENTNSPGAELYRIMTDADRTMQEWQKRRKTFIWGIWDPAPIKNLLNKIKLFFKR